MSDTENDSPRTEKSLPKSYLNSVSPPENYKLPHIAESSKSPHQVTDASKQQSSLLVAVRCRPLLKHEIKANLYEIIRIMDKKLVILLDPVDIEGTEDVLRINRSKEKQYAFDYAFDQSEEILECTTKKLIPGIINGYNSTCFAYGATGAGKTYTMLGTLENPGIMTITLRRLFDAIEENRKERTYKMKFSYLEIYNEMIRDLLGENPTEFLDLREDPIKGLSVAGLSERVGEDSEQVMKYLFIGNKNRTQESTGANEVSSRSHAVFQITVEYVEKNADKDAEVKSGKLSLIDLAGSERAAATNNRGMRMVEGANINRSLLALGNCINKLSDQISKGLRLYIPYRDSKLTRLLKDSLGGNCQTVMIANVSPSNATYEDTHNTLKYANRAKEIKTKVMKNVRNVASHIAQYTAMIAQLKQEIGSLRKQLSISKSTSGKLSISPQAIEEEIQRCVEEINEHHAEEANVRKSLYKIRQKIETLSLAIMIKKSQYETVSRNEKEGTDLLKEISSKEIQLKQLLINEDVLLSRMRDLLKAREYMIHSIKQKPSLPDKWITILIVLIEHEKGIIMSIPTDGDIIAKDIEPNAETQNDVILRLKREIELRDGMISKVKEHLKENNAELNADETRIVSYEEAVKQAREERDKDTKDRSVTFPPLPPSINANEKLFTRVSRFKLPRRQIANNLVQQNTEIVNSKMGKKKELRDDKRSYSVISQNSSFSTGASTGVTPGKLLINNIASKQLNKLDEYPSNNKISHRQLLNAGAHIASGNYHKFTLKNERIPYSLQNIQNSQSDSKSASTKLPRKYLSKLKPEL